MAPPFLVVLLSLLVLTIPLGAAEPSVPARQPLSYKDSGIYSWWQPYLYDSPFDFIITQAIILPHEPSPEGTNSASTPEQIKVWNDSLHKARAAGKRVLVVVSPGQGQPYTEEYYQALERFIGSIDHHELYAITLGEENIFWNGWHQPLSEFYHRIKAKFPDLPVYQFYTNTSRADAHPGFAWPWLPADGWMIDEYLSTPDDFEQAIRRFRMIGKPVVNIVWASPFYSTSGQTSIGYHPNIFDAQLRVSQKYNVPTSYFVWDGPDGRGWPWEERGQQANKDLFKVILEHIGKLDAIKDQDLLDWDNGDRPAPTVLAEADGGALVHREDYNLRMTPEESAASPDFMARSGINGLRHMNWRQDPARIVVLGDGQTPIEAAITNRWVAPSGEPRKLVASANVSVEPGARSQVLLEVSPNGYDWVARSVTTEGGVVRVELPSAASQVYTRLRVSGAAPAGTPLASVDWIEVRAEPSAKD